LQNIVITGATGYLGSHLAHRLLTAYPDTRLLCLARAKNGRSAEARVMDALRTADHIEGDGALVEGYLAGERLWVIDTGDLTALGARISGILLPLLSDAAPEFWHCAAAVAFTETQEGAVWNNNLLAVESALQLAQDIGCRVFNHVSTAYVCGTRHGALEENVGPKPAKFNNIYEESKYACEERVVEFSRETGIAFRIHRPSIIIGHSRTRRTSSRVGFYYCLDIIRQFYQKVTMGDPLFFRDRTVKVLLDADATLNLIPIDVVVAEMLAIRDAGEKTCGQVFHETNPEPIALNDVVTALSEVMGIPNVEVVMTEAGMGLIDKLFNKKMKLLNPYLNRRSHFDRANVIACGADRHRPAGITDVTALKEYANAYLGEFL
jgi:thioester reductase-like protein